MRDVLGRFADDGAGVAVFPECGYRKDAILSANTKEVAAAEEQIRGPLTSKEDRCDLRERLQCRLGF